MKISIEFRNGKFAVTYGKIQGVGSSVKEAIEDLAEKFKAELERFFLK